MKISVQAGIVLLVALGFYLLDIWAVPLLIVGWCAHDGIQFRRDAARRLRNAEFLRQ